jgi:hypothetical protein
VVLVVVGLLVLVVLTLVTARRQGLRVAVARARLQSDLGGADIRRLSGARCLGERGGGTGGDVRGPGALALTGTQLRFVSGSDGRTITISLDRVVGARTTTSFRGSGVTPYHRRPVLAVQWVSSVGGRHEVGWALPEATVWSATITQLVGR